MDTLRICLICDFSSSEHWPFTRFAHELKLTGVYTFRLNIISGDMEFLDDAGGAIYEPQPVRHIRSVSPAIDAPRITMEFQRVLHSNATLSDMSTVLASAGVQFFEVNLQASSCSFYGHAVQVIGQGEFEHIDDPVAGSPARVPPASALVAGFPFEPDNSITRDAGL